MSAKTSQERIDNFFQTSRNNLPEKGHYQASKRVKEAIGKVLGTDGKTNEGLCLYIQSLTKAIIFELFYYVNGYFKV